jgi:hypothetical protein
MYSWLEDLVDPDFPFSAAIKAYSNEEIRKRHEDVSCQLHSLTKGLLEMRKSPRDEDDDERFPMAARDIYFHNEVQFFHRSVRDYLNEPTKQAEIKQRLGRFDVAEAYCRLRLAEFKFARTMNDYFESKTGLGSFLRSSFFSVFGPNAPLRVVEERGRVLDHHKRSPFSFPDETLDNPGVIR